MDRSQIITLLENAEGPLSGEEMSKKLGVSRMAISKAVDALKKEGYEISAAPRRGYVLLSRPDVLDAKRLEGARGAVIGSKVVCLSSIDSTNTEIKRRAMEGAKEGLVVTAEEQVSGRGRVSRSFSSPKGLGLYYSCLLRPNWAPMDAVNITACIAVAVCNAIEKVCSVRPQIKWTNDIILGGKKVCGILTEMEMEADISSIRYIVPGIGINCNHEKNDFPEEIQDIATSLYIETGKKVDRNELATLLGKELDDLYQSYITSSKDYLEKYRKDCCTIGKEVALIHLDGSKEEAFALDIDDDFSLVVRMKDGSFRKVTAGEVSVRGLCGYV